ncbi:tetratricopeptide repeat protein [Acidiphilium sp.]|uniref:tetratricopeptide repeat protein n=1 Tax=Acidiphilium sp. TaxID=527 RepID=UPI002589C254|nr:tetratricopeptide repeat protein [Acidiphilium sp.]
MLDQAADALSRRTPEGDAEALSLANDLLEVNPVNPEAMYIAATALMRMKQNGLAVLLYNAASQLKPEEAAIWNNLGCALQEWHPKDAVAVFAEALERSPGHLEASKNLAAVLGRTGRRAEAIALGRELWNAHPGDEDIPYNLALDLLHTDDWPAAWEAYRYSEGNAQRTERSYYRAGGARAPRWSPKAPGSGRVVIYGEQGVGDEIWAAAMYNGAHAAHKADWAFVLDCDPRLEKIFRRSFPWAQVHGTRDQKRPDWVKATPVDASIIAFGLGETFLRKPRRMAPWLKPDPVLVSMFRAYLARLGDGPKIGLAWTGGATRWERAERSIDPQLLTPFKHIPKAVVVSLEYEDGPVPPGVHEIPWATRKGVDLDVTAALIAALDEVVSVPQTACDIAGAVGTPIRALVGPCPPWRFTEAAGDAWLWEKVRSYRRAEGSTWLPPIARCAHNMREELACPA